MAKQAELPRREDDFSGWYNSVIPRAELAAYGLVGGTQVIRPYGYAIWEHIQGAMDKEIKAAGVENAYFPLFIPMAELTREQDHIEGFAPHLAVVTHGGGKELKDPIAVRPTSETIMYPYYRDWIQSYRDLPVLINQWNNVVRWEPRTTLFLRTMEFLWQEGHTAHATHEEAWTEVRRALDMYQGIYRDVLAIPGYAGKKSESEKFAGADATTTLELLMPDGRALQGCTSHDLGQHFAKAFGITFQDEHGQQQHVNQTSWGFTTRSIGALIMVHGDNKGLRLPPRVAPVQAVVVPIHGRNGESPEVLAAVAQLQAQLGQAGVRVKVDTTDRSPGAKFYHHELKGVPVRIEVGRREVQGGQLTVNRRDTGEDMQMSKDDIAHEIPGLLGDIQSTMLHQAETFLHSNTRDVETYEQFRQIMSGPRGMIRALWCERAECEAEVKAETKANTRCVPFDPPEEHGECFHCGQEAKHRWVFAQSY